MDLRQVVVESDNLTVISASKQHDTTSSTFFLLILEDIFASVNFFDCIVWPFVKQIGNKVTHMLFHLQPLVVQSLLRTTIFLL